MAVAALLAVNLAIVATSAPQAMGYVGLAAVIAIAFVAAFVWVIYTLMPGAHRRRVEARLDTGTPEVVAVRVDGAGLTVDGRLTVWTALSIDELWVRQRLASEQRVTYPERLALSDGRRAIVLDALLQSGGQTLLEQAWRWLKLAQRV